MRRLLALTAFLLIALLPAMSQMRGSRGGGGFHGGPGGGGFHGGGYHGSPGAFRGAPVYRSQVPRSRWGFSGGFGYGAFHGYGYRGYYHHRGFYPYIYPYAYYPYAYAYPYYGVSVYDPGYYYAYSDNNQYEAQQQQQQVNAQINSLSQQIQDLREQNDDLRAYVQQTDKYARPPVAQPDRSIPQSLQQPAAQTPSTVLVLRDGRQIEARNYAIVGHTVWVLSEKRSEKIPLDSLDLEKTQQENEKRGVEFIAPTQQ
ncbi:MAG: hypothetical protein ACXVZV_15970 [Terriglobales bacterium]